MEIFLLDSSKLNEILYSMENQNKESYIEIKSGIIHYSDKGETLDIKEEIYPLPLWRPIEGFRIMNDFVFHLKNPIVKEELKQVLNSGHGVFRKFKNVLKNNSEVEKLWFSFKKSEMKTHVLNWYNQVREYVGLELFSENDFEDEQDLLGFDFTIEKGKPEDFSFIADGDKKGFTELYSHYPSDVIDDLYSQKRENILCESMYESDFIFTSKAPTGENVGFAWATGYTLGEKFIVMELLQLYVIPEYRGLGIGKLLLNKILSKYREGGFEELIASCQKKSSWLINFLELENLTLASQELCFRS